MYIVYDIRNNKVVKESENPFVVVGNNHRECYVEDLPYKSDNQYYEVINVREETKVVKEAYSEEEIYWNEETEQEETRIVEFPAITKTYTTCDILVKDRPQPSEEVKAQLIAQHQEARYKRRTEQLIRQKYSQGDVEALTFNYFKDPVATQAEYEAFQAYREKCKKQARIEIYGV